MKMAALRLLAYGPFSDETIDLAAGTTDFHLIFGPNEAGKSSSLRAIRHALFGIPAQTADNFRHVYPRLRIGARLIHSDGRRIDFVRRKGRIKTLRGADDEAVLEDDTLAAYLDGVGQDLFEQMFAIGHDDLVQGGEEIISGKGRIGEALFAAGAGLIQLQQVQLGLDQACGELFKPSGSAPAINRTLAALKAVRKAQKEALLPAGTWQAHDRRLRQARRRMADVQSALAVHRQQEARLQRIQAALPLIARRKEVRSEIDALGRVPDLPADFSEKRRDAEAELMVSRRDRDQSLESVTRLEARIDGLPVPEALLASATAVAALQHDLGSYRKAQQDRPGLDGRMRTLRSQVTESLSALGRDGKVDTDDAQRLPPSLVGDIQALGQSFERLTARQASVDAQQEKRRARHGRLLAEREKMPRPVDVGGLERSVQKAQSRGPLADRRAERVQSADALADDLARRLERQNLWRGELETVDSLPLPSMETIERFAREFDALDKRTGKISDDAESVQGELERLEAELRNLDPEGTVPTEADLVKARTLRGRGWMLIRRTLADERPVDAETHAFCIAIGPGLDLPEAFESSVARADEVADRLRREADKVSRKALLESRRAELTARLTRITQTREHAVAARDDCQARWRQLWAPLAVDPLSPAEMRAWTTGMARIAEQMAGLREHRQHLAAMDAEIAELTRSLADALAVAGDDGDENSDLADLLDRARAQIDRQKTRAARLAETDRQIAGLADEIADGATEAGVIAREYARWQTAWAKTVHRIGLDRDARPSAALAVIDSLREVKQKLADADVLQKRIDGIDRDAADFVERVGRLVQDLAPDLAAEPVDRAAETLNARLNTARKDASVRGGLVEQRDTARRSAAEATMRMDQARARLESLCREAGCRQPDALADVEARARQRAQLRITLDGVDDRLRELSAGATVDAFTSEAEAEDSDAIGADLAVAREAIDQLEQERSDLDQTIGMETAEQRRMDGSAVAAGHAEEAERLLGTLESDAAQYARLKIAAVILTRTVERYRDRHQGPLIRRASDLFAHMTLGAFARLRAEYDEKGNPILVGIRCGSEAQVTVDGMSDGTADQLYLALRLASLEQYLENNEPLPFIVDDILLRFDDARALATLKILAELSTKTQVIFFTHHRHLVDLVQESRTLAGAVNHLTLAV